MKTILSTLCITVLFGTVVTAVSGQNTLQIHVKNISSNDGKIMVATDKGQYNWTKAIKGEATLRLDNIPVGECTLYVYHDENENYELDKDKNGRPLECCAIAEIDVTAETSETIVTLVDYKETVNKK